MERDDKEESFFYSVLTKGRHRMLYVKLLYHPTAVTFLQKWLPPSIYVHSTAAHVLFAITSKTSCLLYLLVSAHLIL